MYCTNSPGKLCFSGFSGFQTLQYPCLTILAEPTKLSLSSYYALAFLSIVLAIQMHKLSVSFGHGVGFTLGLIFLNPIFTLILAFGSSEYIGAQD